MVKRFIDLLLVISSALLWLPLLLVVSLLVASFLGRPVLFRQQRPGLKGQPFEILKFRTMMDSRTESGALLPDVDRLTSFGRFLRSTSLDELPELINVIKGEMSLVGPRPLLMEYLPLYSAEQARRHDLPPGITGWAQINGRNDIAWEEKLALDCWYVDNQSLLLDLKILWRTVFKVFAREGVNQAGEATTSKFTGGKTDE